MLVLCSLLVFALLTMRLSPSAGGVASAASCIDCPPEDGDSNTRGKLSFNSIIPADEDFLKTIALASSPSLLGGGGESSGVGLSPQQQQKARFFRTQQQHHQKILAQQQQHHQQRVVPSTSSAGISSPPIPPSNLLHIYTLLNKGTVQEPRLLIDEYYLQDPEIPLSSRIAKKAERGMLVDVLDYVSKPDDRNRRVGQNMRSSG